MCVWDSQENIKQIELRSQMFEKPCGCTKGCGTKSCGCVKRGVECLFTCKCCKLGNCKNKKAGNVQEEGSTGTSTQLSDQILSDFLFFLIWSGFIQAPRWEVWRNQKNHLSDFLIFLNFTFVCYFQLENGVSVGREVPKKLPGGGALRCDRILCCGELWGPGS